MSSCFTHCFIPIKHISKILWFAHMRTSQRAVKPVKREVWLALKIKDTCYDDHKSCMVLLHFKKCICLRIRCTSLPSIWQCHHCKKFPIFLIFEPYIASILKWKTGIPLLKKPSQISDSIVLVSPICHYATIRLTQASQVLLHIHSAKNVSPRQ